MGTQGVSVVEQARRLAAVDLGGLSSDRVMQMQQRRRWRLIVKGLRSRLEQWAEFCERRGQDAVGGCGSVMGAIVECQGDFVRSTNPSANGMPDGIYATEKAFQALTDGSKDAVRAEYFGVGKTQSERAQSLGVQVRAYQRRLDKAHKEIYEIFSELDSTAGGAFWQSV